jgi:hypothetical protein
LLSQLNSKSSNPNERRQIEMFKQMLPLYEKHDFWDTQPVPKSGLGEEVSETIYPLIMTNIINHNPHL